MKKEKRNNKVRTTEKKLLSVIHAQGWTHLLSALYYVCEDQSSSLPASEDAWKRRAVLIDLTLIR